MQTLARRQGLLDGVVFSGGEPTLDASLPEAIAEVRALGFRVGLHTAGLYPERLAALLPDLDWVGFDLKTLPEVYADITQVPRSGEPAWQSLQLLRDRQARHGLGLEVRTTWHPQLHQAGQMVSMARLLQAQGIDHWVLQPYRGDGLSGTPHERLRASMAMPSAALRAALDDTGLRCVWR